MTTNNSKTANCMERDTELLTLYNEALHLMIKNRVPNPDKSALTWALTYGQPRYCLSYRYAYRTVCRILGGENVKFSSLLRRQMWEEVCRKVQSLTVLHPTLSIAKAIEFVLLNTRASRFFLSERQAKRSIQKCRRQYRRRLQTHIFHHQS